MLAERPGALGLMVPDMSMASPGMKMGDHRDAYAELLVLRGSSTEVFESHA